MARTRRNPPARVTSAAYRSGFDGTFGPKRRKRSSAKGAIARARARRMPRDAKGRYLKRGTAKRRAAPKRRASPKRRRSTTVHARRGRRGRFASRYTPKYTRRAQRRKARKHLRAIRTIKARHRIAGLVRLNPRTGEIIMSKARVANPRRRRRNSRRATSTVTVANRRRRRNPRAKRRNPRAMRLRNPLGGGVMKAVKSSAVPMGMGMLGGATVGFIDAKFLAKSPTATIASKFLLGIAGALVLRKKPLLAMGWAGGCLGTFGYTFGIKMGGGIVARDASGALAGIAEMADENPEMAAMLAGMGDVVDDMGDASEYAEALGDVVSDDVNSY